MRVNDCVAKVKGYPYVGRIVSVYGEGPERRYVVKFAASNMQHIFNEEQLIRIDEAFYKVVEGEMNMIFSIVQVQIRSEELKKKDA